MALNTEVAMRVLNYDLMDIKKDPIEGCNVKLLSEEDIFNWEVTVFGPPNTLFEGGYFKAHMNFPPDYPYSPPTITFLKELWHPNVHKNGDLYISILHHPINVREYDRMNNERWNPTRNVRSVLLSVLSLLNEPNLMFAVNSHAARLYRKWIDSKGASKEYEKIVRDQVLATQAEAAKDGVNVPTTVQEYCTVSKHDTKQKSDDMLADYEEEFLFDDTDYEYDTDSEYYRDSEYDTDYDYDTDTDYGTDDSDYASFGGDTDSDDNEW